MNEQTIDFHVEPDELLLIEQIVVRYVQLGKIHNVNVAPIETMMDVVFTHTKNYKLNLHAILLTSDHDFLTEIAGIVRNMDRTTGLLKTGYQPSHRAC